MWHEKFGTFTVITNIVDCLFEGSDFMPFTYFNISLASKLFLYGQIASNK